MSRVSPSWPPVRTELPAPHPLAPPPGTELVSHYEGCFGCGSTPVDGLRLRASVVDGYTIRAWFTLTDAHQGAPGRAHGGLLACAFDEALGAVVGHLLREPAVTGSLETDFVRPVPIGTTLHINSRLRGVAGRQVYISGDGRIDAPDGPIAVRARGIFVTVPVEAAR